MSWKDIGGKMQGIPWQALRDLYSISPTSVAEVKPGSEPKGIVTKKETDKDLSDGERRLREKG